MRPLDDTNSRCIELKSVPLGLINSYKNDPYNELFTVIMERLLYVKCILSKTKKKTETNCWKP